MTPPRKTLLQLRDVVSEMVQAIYPDAQSATLVIQVDDDQPALLPVPLPPTPPTPLPSPE